MGKQYKQFVICNRIMANTSHIDNLVIGWRINIKRIPEYKLIDNNVFYEKMNRDLVMGLLERNDYTEITKNMFRNNILQDIENNCFKTTYYQTHGLGRYYSNTITNYPRKFKHTIFKDQGYIDLDMVKGHPSIVLWLARKNKISLPCIEKYVNNPKCIFDDMTSYYGDNLQEHQKKWVFNMLIYGGSPETWISDITSPPQKDIDKGWTATELKRKDIMPFISNFKGECDILKKVVFRMNPELVKRVTTPELPTWKKQNRVISYFLQIIENHSLYFLYKYLCETSFIKDNIVCLEKDGLCFPPAKQIEDTESFVKDVNEYLVKTTGIDVRYKIKEYENENIDQRLIDRIRSEREYEEQIENIASIDHEPEENLEPENELYITIDDLNKGETKLLELILPILKRQSVYSQKRFYVIDKKTNIWIRVDNIQYLISQILKKMIDYSIYSNSLKLKNVTSDDIRKDLRETIASYNKFYSTTSRSGLLSCIEKHCKVVLHDKTFYDLLDSKINIIAFKNGVYDLTNKTLRPIKRNDYISKTLDYDYNHSNHEDKLFVKQQLLKICNGNQEHLEYYLSVLGHSITGMATEEKSLYFFMGELGNNGKTTILDILTTIMPIYVSKCSRELVSLKSNDKHKYIAGLHGKRIVWIDELRENHKLDTAYLKEIADGRSLNYKVMYGETAELNVRFKLFMITNHTPKYSNDGGMDKRTKLLKFNSHFGDYENDDFENLKFIGDNQLTYKMTDKYKFALMDTIFEAAYQYNKTKSIKPYPLDFQEEKELMSEANDDSSTFFNENCEIGSTFKCSKQELESACESLTFLQLKDNLTRLGYKYNRNLSFGIINNKRVRGGWCGFRLTTTFPKNITNGGLII